MTHSRLTLHPSDPSASGAASSPLHVFRALGAVPPLRECVYRLGGRLLVGGTIPDREREIVILRTAARTGSDYEFAQHAVLAAGYGLREEEISGCLDLEHPWPFPDDAALVALADDIHDHGRVSEDNLHELSSRWTDSELIELVFTAGFYRMVAGFLTTFDVELDPGLSMPSTREREAR